MSCIFCKIINQEIHSKKIFEDEKTYAFLDIDPVTDGHILVIPKKHYVDVDDCDEEYLKEVISTCKKIGGLLIEKLNATGFNILNASGKDAQQTVFHLHFHVVPRFKDDGLDMWYSSKNKKKSVDKIYSLLKK